MTEWKPEENSVYYRPIQTEGDRYTVVSMQWFDEYDYDQDRFVNTVLYEEESDAWFVLMVMYGTHKLDKGFWMDKDEYKKARKRISEHGGLNNFGLAELQAGVGIIGQTVTL